MILKRIASILLALLLASSCIFAHSGRTDANGGHYDRSTGEYHYHHGYPAHQHVNGTCPYDFDDKTGQSSGSSSSGSTNVDNLLNNMYQSSGNIHQTSGENEQNDSFWDTIILFYGVGIFLCWLPYILGLLYCFIIDKCLHSNYVHYFMENEYLLVGWLPLPALLAVSNYFLHIDKISYYILFTLIYSIIPTVIITVLEKNKQTAKEQAEKEQAEKKRAAFEAERIHYLALYGGKPIESLVSIPPDTEIAPDGLPREKGVLSGYGATYTRYVTPNGKSYHTSTCKYAAHAKAVHVCNLSGLSPCKLCHPEFDSLNWYWDYRKILRIKQKYHID